MSVSKVQRWGKGQGKTGKRLCHHWLWEESDHLHLHHLSLSAVQSFLGRKSCPQSSETDWRSEKPVGEILCLRAQVWWVNLCGWGWCTPTRSTLNNPSVPPVALLSYRDLQSCSRSFQRLDLKERWFPNHAEYEFLVQQDEGKGWPDFKNEQAKIMLMGQQFVFFISPWSSGKTIYHRHEREGSHVGDTESKRKAVLCGCGYAGIWTRILDRLDFRHKWKQQK